MLMPYLGRQVYSIFIQPSRYAMVRQLFSSGGIIPLLESSPEFQIRRLREKKTITSDYVYFVKSCAAPFTEKRGFRDVELIEISGCETG
jgi:hypothetical protein